MEQKLRHISFWTFLSLRNQPLKIKALYDALEKCSLVRFPWNLGQVILYVWELVKLVCVDKSGTGQVGSGKTEETCRWLMIPPLQNTALRHITVLRQLLMLSLRCQSLFVTLLTMLDCVILDFQHLNPVTSGRLSQLAWLPSFTIFFTIFFLPFFTIFRKDLLTGSHICS